MKKQTWLKGGIASAVLLIILLVVGLAVSSGDSGSATSIKPGTAINVLVAGKGCDKNAVATQALKNQGFKDGEFALGQDQVDWSSSVANQRGSTAFSTQTPKSAQELTTGLKSQDEKTKAALAALEKQSGATRSQLLDPNNWVSAQFKVKSAWPGNTSYSSGTAINAGTRKSDSGDVAWLFVHPDVCVQVMNEQVPAEQAVTAHRAGCGNPQTALPTPSGKPVPTTSPPVTTVPPATTIPPSPTTTPPPVTVPPCQSGKCVPPTTTPPPPVTEAPPTVTPPAPPPPGNSGPGAPPAGVTPPPTVAPPAPPPPTVAPPTTPVTY